MSEIVSQIFVGIIVAIILSWFGLSGSKKVIIQSSGKVKKSGKWIMIFSGILIFVGLAWATKNPSSYNTWQPGHSLALLFFFVFLIGKMIAWFQRN